MIPTISVAVKLYSIVNMVEAEMDTTPSWIYKWTNHRLHRHSLYNTVCIPNAKKKNQVY